MGYFGVYCNVNLLFVRQTMTIYEKKIVALKILIDLYMFKK